MQWLLPTVICCYTVSFKSIHDSTTHTKIQITQKYDKNVIIYSCKLTQRYHAPAKYT